MLQLQIVINSLVVEAVKLDNKYSSEKFVKKSFPKTSVIRFELGRDVWNMQAKSKTMV